MPLLGLAELHTLILLPDSVRAGRDSPAKLRDRV